MELESQASVSGERVSHDHWELTSVFMGMYSLVKLSQELSSKLLPRKNSPYVCPENIMDRYRM